MRSQFFCVAPAHRQLRRLPLSLAADRIPARGYFQPRFLLDLNHPIPDADQHLAQHMARNAQPRAQGGAALSGPSCALGLKQRFSSPGVDRRGLSSAALLFEISDIHQVSLPYLRGTTSVWATIRKSNRRGLIGFVASISKVELAVEPLLPIAGILAVYLQFVPTCRSHPPERYRWHSELRRQPPQLDDHT
jgi:hypothetical protein